jgi:hypothetical protein
MSGGGPELYFAGAPVARREGKAKRVVDQPNT